jgi:rare lipoprotein A (peptidoglycan hydrolase)
MFTLTMRKLLPKAPAVLAPLSLLLLVAPSLQAPMILSWVRTGTPIKTWTTTASWYGPGFDGRTTASGQPYDMHAATAAHPWLPLGSLVRVVNLRTGESQLARINDRGPYWGDRELDVSYMVASRLSMIEPGTASVRIELLEQPPRRQPTP